jgi:AcrR family transcriptional regulator
MDARARRSRTKLSAAVLDLAERDGIEAVSMVAVAQAAGVNRSTVYEHASSPLDLLRSVLRDELDSIRDRHLAPGAHDDVGVAVRKTTIDVLQHVDDHAAIYSRALGSEESTALHGMLSAHFRESALRLFRNGAITPTRVDGIDPRLQDETTARYIADGTVGAIDAWLATPPPRSVPMFLRLYATVLPPWWPLG